MVVEIAIHAPGNFRRLRTERGPAALQENDGHDAANVGVRVGGEPAITRTRARTGSSLAPPLFFSEIVADPSRRAVLDCSRHAVRNFRNQRSDIEVALDAGLEVGNLLRRARMLHVV